jgi:hypothetical protein
MYALTPPSTSQIILLERAPAAVRNQTNDGGFSAYVLPLGNVEKNNGRAPWGDAPRHSRTYWRIFL